MSLRDWLANGWLTEQATGRREIADMLAAVDRDLHECTIPDLSADWKLNIAYAAALRLATAALAATGYRASREQHHYRVIQSLTLTISADPSLVREIDHFRKKRNIAVYDQAGIVSDYEAERMIELAHTLRDRVIAWLRETCPDVVE